MNRLFVTRPSVALMLMAASLTTHVIPFASELATQSWHFDAESANSLPFGFQIGTLFDGRPAGEWKVLETEKAKSTNHILAQLQGKGAEHAYKIVLINGTESSDAELTVSFLAIDGKADMGGGLIWRAADDRNYYLTRANPLEQNIRIYRVQKGVRHIIKNFDHIIDTKQWHTLRVIAKGCQFQVTYDDTPVFDICDRTFKKGKVGLWTKSDAITFFDDLQLTKY